MDNKDLQKIARKVATGMQASRQSDPRFYGGLSVLPNPDPILRKMGKTNEVFDAIMADAHVVGEVRSIRAALLGYQFRVVAGDNAATEDAIAQQAKALCEQWINTKPAKHMTWPDVIWNMAEAVLRGMVVHELDWQVIDGNVLPEQVLDRPSRRFIFNNDNELRVRTKSAPNLGEEIEDYRYILTRHMPSNENPYGRAVLSSCFWPYTFKHGGFKFFYEFCERFGLPWAIGKYPAGTELSDQQALVDALVAMVDAGAAAIPQDDSVELLEAKSAGGELAQEQMIHLCNREMSKALTSQTLATEMKDVGSNAAAKTHSERQANVNEGDRHIVAAAMNDVFKTITRFNFGDDVVSPKFEFYKEKEVRKERAEIYEIAARISPQGIS